MEEFSEAFRFIFSIFVLMIVNARKKLVPEKLRKLSFLFHQQVVHVRRLVYSLWSGLFSQHAMQREVLV